MTFDLIAYAELRRVRVRNLHDGGKCPPARSRNRPPTPAYRSAADRMDAIVGKRGHVTVEHGKL